MSSVDSGPNHEIVTSTMIEHFLRGDSVFFLIDEFENNVMRSDPEMNEFEREPLYLREGECFSHSFNMDCYEFKSRVCT